MTYALAEWSAAGVQTQPALPHGGAIARVAVGDRTQSVGKRWQGARLSHTSRAHSDIMASLLRGEFFYRIIHGFGRLEDPPSD